MQFTENIFQTNVHNVEYKVQPKQVLFVLHIYIYIYIYILYANLPKQASLVSILLHAARSQGEAIFIKVCMLKQASLVSILLHAAQSQGEAVFTKVCMLDFSCLFCAEKNLSRNFEEKRFYYLLDKR